MKKIYNYADINDLIVDTGAKNVNSSIIKKKKVRCVKKLDVDNAVEDNVDVKGKSRHSTVIYIYIYRKLHFYIFMYI